MAFTGDITEIWVQYDTQHLTIWKPGFSAPVAVQVPAGKTWELHLATTARYPEAGATGWATAMTLGGASIDAADARLHGPFMTVGDYEFAFNMGVMTNSPVNVGRARFWWNTAYTNTPPPKEQR